MSDTSLSAASWLKVNPSAVQAIKQYEAFLGTLDENRFRSAGHEAGKHYVKAIQERITSGPDTNGSLHEDLDFRDVVPHVKTWDEAEHVSFGVPTDNPASDRAAWMEYGDVDNPPTPVMFDVVKNQELRQQALQAFYEKLLSRD